MNELQVSTIQIDLAWEDKEANLDKIEKIVRTLSTRTHIAILPELCTTGFSLRSELLAETMDGKSVRTFQALSQQYRMILVASLLIKEGQQNYNRLCWFFPNGRIDTYDKKHLFAYAHEDKHYTAGNKRLITSVNSWKMYATICYDLRFPVWCRQGVANSEYDMLVCVASWPHARIDQWASLLKARAIENQAYVIGVNRVGTDGLGLFYSGGSMIVSPEGVVLYSVFDKEEVHTHTFEKKTLQEIRAMYPFGKDADAFVILPSNES